MGLSELLYVSEAVTPLCLNDLLLIQEHAIRKNARQNITGILLHSEGQLVQFLEGEFTAVNELYQVIERDRRHTQVKMLYHRPSLGRLFASWHMAMLDLDLHTEAERQNLQDMVQLACDHDGDRYDPPADLEVLRQFQRLWADSPAVLK